MTPPRPSRPRPSGPNTTPSSPPGPTPPRRPAGPPTPSKHLENRTVFEVLGQITARLRRVLPADDPAWTPPRSSMHPVTRPAGEGRQVGAGPDRRKK